MNQSIEIHFLPKIYFLLINIFSIIPLDLDTILLFIF
jgi:hypothetical protein